MFKIRPFPLTLAILVITGFLFLFGCVDHTSGPVNSLRVFHNLSSPGTGGNGMVVIGPEATDFTFIGLDASGMTRYGPVTFTRNAEHLLIGVPSDVVLLIVEYYNGDGSLHAMAEVAVPELTNGTTAVMAQATKELAVQIVNDSHMTDEEVYVLLSANGEIQVDTEGGTLAIYQIGTGSNDVSAQPLSRLHSVGSRVSPLTGESRKVYEFKPKQVVSGRLWISYGEPLTYQKGDHAPPNDPPGPNVRYDKMEMGYQPGNPIGYFDLTSVDFFGIPMQLEVLADSGDKTPLRVTTFYSSTLTLLKALYDLDPNNMDNAFYQKGTPPTKGWMPTTEKDLDTFLRVMSPSTLVSQAPAQAGDPYTAAPYPSFANYLTDLANQGAYVDLSGENGVDGGKLTQWAYRAAITSDGKDGFVVTCRPTDTMNNMPQGSIGDTNYPGDPSLPQDLTVEMPLTKEFFDSFIYGVPANSFTVKDLDCHLIPYSKNSVYADIAGNFLAGLNFGYLGGRYGNNAQHWFDVLPGYPPYAAARPAPDDGYYNPYAAVLYNLSDAYSYSISDRLKIGNPLVTTSPDKPYLRITILPDKRLDAPENIQVTQGRDGTSFNVSWDPVADPPAGFTLTGYRVMAIDGSVPVADPKRPPPTQIQLNEWAAPPFGQNPTTGTSATLTGLNPNTAYQVWVVAEGTHDGQTVTSTRGNFVEVATPSQSGSDPTSFINFSVGVSEPAGAPAGTAYQVDGMTVSNSQTQALKRSKPDQQGDLVQALFEIKGPDPASPGTDITYAQTNVLFNVFDAGNDNFNAYFNFPFSSSVPTTTQSTTLMDGSALNFAYSPTFGANKTPQPPFGDTANSLVAIVGPNPTNRPKTPKPVMFPSQTPVTPNPSPPVAPSPSYTPTPHTPVTCPKFVVTAVLGTGSPVNKLSDLKGSTVQFVRLVTTPGSPGGTPQMPAVDGSGADAKLVLDDTGSVQFDPTQVPYNAPIWKLGYRVDIVYHDAAKDTDTTYSAYGAWTQPEVGSEWYSGLSGQTDQPGVIYVAVYPNPSERVVWGN